MSQPGKEPRATAFLAYVKALMMDGVDMFKEPQDFCAQQGRKIVESSGVVCLKSRL